MYFCPRCGSAMIVKQNYLLCLKCRYSSKLDQNIQYLKKSTVLAKSHEKKIDIDNIGLPFSAIYDDNIICPQCGYKGVYYWRRHRSSAESSDIIEKVYKCSKCGYGWTELE